MSGKSLKVVIVGINYAPEPTGIAPYTTGLARGLQNRGYDVTVLTGQPHYPYWRRLGGASEFRSDESLDGVRVRRFRHVLPKRGANWLGRVAMELSFGLQIVTTRWGRPDVVICVTPPLLATAAAVLRARLTWHRPAVGVLVQDLYHRGISETNVTSGLPAWAIRTIESIALRSSDGVSVIHSGFRSNIDRCLRVKRENTRVIRNWTHVGHASESASASFREKRCWNGAEIVALHAGNMGYKQGLENVVAAAELAGRTGAKVRFVLLGDGNQRAVLEQAALGVDGLEFLQPVEDAEFPAALGAADVLLVNERPGVGQMSVPSKLTSYFQSGKPVVAATDPAGFTAAELEASGAGVCVPAGEPEKLLAEVLRMGSDFRLANRYGCAGRTYSEELLSEDAALDSYEQWVIELSRREPGWTGEA